MRCLVRRRYRSVLPWPYAMTWACALIKSGVPGSRERRAKAALQSFNLRPTIRKLSSHVIDTEREGDRCTGGERQSLTANCHHLTVAMLVSGSGKWAWDRSHWRQSMSITSPFSCFLGHHQPNRNRVHWDGRVYHGRCKHCSATIEHISRRNWREFTA